MTDSIPEYVVFVSYDSLYPSRAIFVDADKITDIDIVQKINQLKTINSKIVYDGTQSHQYLIDDKVVDDPTKKVLDYWNSLVIAIDHDYNGNIFSQEFYDNSYYMYLSGQKYRRMSPGKLFQALSSKSKIGSKTGSKKILVTKCVMVSDVAYERVPESILRYFTTGEINDAVLDNIVSIPGVIAIQPAKKSDTVFETWGYIKVQKDLIENFAEQTYTIGDRNIYFDYC